MDRKDREVVDNLFSPETVSKLHLLSSIEVTWCMYVGEVRRFSTTRPFIRSFIQSFIEFFFFFFFFLFFFFFHCLYVYLLTFVNSLSASVLTLLSSLSLPGYMNRINTKLGLRANDWE